MRIINGHDYYDSSLAYGHDPKVVFVRDEGKYLPKETFKKPHSNVYFLDPEDVGREYHWSHKSEFLSKKNERWEPTFIRVIFCGILYTGIRMIHTISDSRVEKEDVFFWSREAFQSWVDGFKKVAYFSERHFFGDENYCCIPITITGEEYSKLLKNRISIAIFRGDQKGWEINCSGLRDIQFYKVFDSVTAFQELDMWMSGALGMPGNPMVEVSDEYRILKHGMDKWSFRKKVR
jgi:hypothetical protein